MVTRNGERTLGIKYGILSRNYSVGDKTLSLSVVIRTRDKESYFEHLLKNLASQTLHPSEIVVVDNCSNREKLKLLEKDLRRKIKRYSKLQKIKLIPIVDSEFSHAYSTNLGVHFAENELVSIINAHSVPISFKWLEQGVKYFEDPKVAGVSGFFIPHKEGFAFGRFDVILYYFFQKMISHEKRFCTINCIIRKCVNSHVMSSVGQSRQSCVSGDWDVRVPV